MSSTNNKPDTSARWLVKFTLAKHSNVWYNTHKGVDSMRKEWSKDDLNYLIENYETLGLVECSKQLNRSQGSILHKACRLGIKRRGIGRAVRYKMYDGYLVVSDVNDRYFVHRRVMEEYLGRKLPALPEGVKKMPISVPRYFIDTNHHVNNAQYVDIGLCMNFRENMKIFL